MNTSPVALPGLVTVHCFYGCDHIEVTDPGKRSRAMEVHYADAHAERLSEYPPATNSRSPR